MDKSVFIQRWKRDIVNQLMIAYNNKLDMKEIDKLLNALIHEKMINRTLKVFNNYTNKLSRTNILTLVDLIENNNIIVSGGGCMFLPHGSRRNLLFEFIQYKKLERKLIKNERKKYMKGTKEYQKEDIAQNNTKLIINSWYGCMGYPGFLMYNVFIAEAITNQGRNIITSCIAAFENYIGDGVIFTCEGELFTYLENIISEFNDNGYDKVVSKYRDDFLVNDYKDMCKDRLLSKCTFKVSDSLKIFIDKFCNNITENQAIVLYYKNNLEEFNNLPFMRNRFTDIITRNGALLFGALNYMKEEVREDVLTVLSLYKLFIFYSYPTYDKVRKGMYLVKKKCLYTDTDSVFISLSAFVSYTLSLFDNKEAPGLSLEETKSTGAFLHFYFVDVMVDIALKVFCKSLNIPEDVAQALLIKNEFFYLRIAFMDVKKRYLALGLYQEGNKIPASEALDVKGMDFKKSTTNQHLRNFYTDITLEEILLVDEIDPISIFKRMVNLKTEIEDGIRRGDRRFFKQSIVKLPEHYKNPYSTQGVIATMLWNILCPELLIAMPAEVYIVPINSLKFDKPSNEKKALTAKPTDNKFIKKFSEKYPVEYKYLYDNIYCNSNALIRHMSLNYIAFPRNEEVAIPKHVIDIIDMTKITEDALALYLPVLNSIGLKNLPTTTTTTHMSNIVNI